ncbi:hypothetical protein GCM10025854_22390 [Tetragenococcus muriaticus]|nr:hypothetical protein GCM10025854_22390 [Tetragenococcus muriaticus]
MEKNSKKVYNKCEMKISVIKRTKENFYAKTNFCTSWKKVNGTKQTNLPAGWMLT